MEISESKECHWKFRAKLYVELREFEKNTRSTTPQGAVLRTAEFAIEAAASLGPKVFNGAFHRLIHALRLRRLRL
jgi:hypothetical protein